MKRSSLVEGSTTIAVCLAALAVLVLALLLGATVAQAAMIVLPFSPHGAVTLDSAPVPDGTLVAAYCGGNVYRSGLTTAGQYALAIPGDDPATPATDGCVEGEPVYFYIGSGLSDQVTTWASDSSPRLDLSRSLTWDKSTLTLTGKCLPDGRVEYAVTNGGQDMAGPAEWQLYGTPTITAGVFQLAAGASQVWTFGPFDYAVDFAVEQRPAHPGSSHPHLELSCQPTAITLSAFRATTAGPGLCLCTTGARTYPCTLRFERVGLLWLPRQVCIPPQPAHAGKIAGLASPLERQCRVPEINLRCTVAAAGSGWAYGDCDMGKAFSSTTKLKLKADDKVLVAGCQDATGNIPDATITRSK